MKNAATQLTYLSSQQVFISFSNVLSWTGATGIICIWGWFCFFMFIWYGKFPPWLFRSNIKWMFAHIETRAGFSLTCSKFEVRAEFNIHLPNLKNNITQLIVRNCAQMCLLVINCAWWTLFSFNTCCRSAFHYAASDDAKIPYKTSHCATYRSMVVTRGPHEMFWEKYSKGPGLE